jgi:hypothetical protein
MTDAGGAELAKIQGDIETGGGIPPGGREASVNMVINMANTRFDKPGEYWIDIAMNDQPMKRLPLRVATVPVA